MKWISFDLDAATGDCRNLGDAGCCCARRCGGKDSTPARATGTGYYDTHTRFEQFTRHIQEAGIIPPVIVRDSHAAITRFLHEGDSVVNFDFHSDDYPDLITCKLSCANWVLFVERRSVSVAHCVDPQPVDGPARLFIAVSRPYTNPELDERLFEFLIDLEMSVDLNGGL